MMQVSLPSEYRRPSLALGLKPVLADTLRVKEGGLLRHIFFDIGHDQLIAFLEPHDGCGHQSRARCSRRHFIFEAGSPAALADKRDELRAKGVEVTDIVDHGWSRSIYFKDPNGPSLEYCCTVRNLTEDDAIMQERYTIPSAALNLGNATSAKVSKA
jgi:catechol 2,3-dioxygenase-like lactoylglutathione lyase family enzyme